MWCDLYTPSPSNQSFYRLIASYQRGVGDHRWANDERGVMGLQISYSTLIGVLSTMHLMHAAHAPQLRHYNYYVYDEIQ